MDTPRSTPKPEFRELCQRAAALGYTTLLHTSAPTLILRKTNEQYKDLAGITLEGPEPKPTLGTSIVEGDIEEAAEHLLRKLDIIAA